MKRYRKKFSRHNQLRVTFYTDHGKPDILYSFDGGCPTDTRMLHHALSSPRYGYEGMRGNSDPSVFEELINRGYDITTFDLKISKLDPNDTEKVLLNQQFLKML